jgi:tRNA (guanine-N7-)-methyltransferase
MEKNNKKYKFYGRVKGKKLSQFKQLILDHILDLVRYDKSVWRCKGEKWLEIGFGHGEHMVYQAKQNPDKIIVGAEVFQNGIADLLGRIIDREQLLLKYQNRENVFGNKGYLKSVVKYENLKIFPDDIRLIYDEIPDNSLERVFVLYPDPWPKLRHNKRRIISKENIAEFSRMLKVGGVLRIATDIFDYYDWAKEKTAAFAEFALDYDSEIPYSDWVMSKYEAKAKKAGRISRYLEYKRQRIEERGE